MPASPSIPIKTGSIVAVSACGIIIPNPAHNGETKKLTRNPSTHTQAVAGLHEL